MKKKQIMKKTIILLSAVFALFACNKEPQLPQGDSQDFQVNLTITRADEGAATKATVKTGWASGDVVYVFISSAAAPKYLEMKYNGSVWTPSAKNGLTTGDIVASGTMTAVYLPYGNELTVSNDGGAYAFSETYSGHFYMVEGAIYSYSANILTGAITLTAALPAGSDKLVHFDVTGYTAGHTYDLYQDYMKPLQFTGVDSEGNVNKKIGTAGDAIPGYIDAANSIVSFSGVLDESAVGSSKNYFISIRDTEDGTLYYRNADDKTVSANQYIGLGNLTSAWTVATPGAFTVSAGGDRITFARSNLSYRGSFEDAGKKWQLMKYPWTVIEGSSYTETGEIGYFAWGTSGWDNTKNEPYWINYQPWTYLTWSYPTVNEKNVYGLGPTSVDKDNVKHLTDENANGDWGVYNTIYSYGGGVLGGTWRTPSRTDFFYLFGRTANSLDDPEHARYRMYGRVALNDGEKTIRGVVLIPDQSWVDPRSTTFQGTPNSYFNNGNNDTYGGEASLIGEEGMESSEATNYYTMVNWNKMEAAGAVFLPMAGYRDPSLMTLNTKAAYWSSTSGFNANIYDKAYALTVQSDGESDDGKITYLCSASLRRLMCTVRLVRDMN